MKVKPSVKPICEKCSVRAKGPGLKPWKPYPKRLGAKCVDSRRRPRLGHGMLLMEVLYGTYCWC